MSASRRAFSLARASRRQGRPGRAGGGLTGKGRAQARAAWPGRWRESAWYKRVLGPGAGERSLAVAEGLRPIADRLNATVAQVAIAWVLHQPGVTAAIARSHEGGHTKEKRSR